MLIIPLSIIGIDKPVGEMIGDVSDATRLQSYLGRWEYLATQGRVIMTYLRLVVLPVNQNLDYDYPVYRSFLEPAVLGSFGVLALLWCLGIYLAVRSRKGEPGPGLIAYGIFWFFITLSVESSVIPIVDVIFEHRMYLPMVGVVIGVSTAVFTGIEELGRRKPVAKPAAAAVIAGLMVLVMILGWSTYRRNRIWQSQLSLWEDVVRKSPEKMRGNYSLANEYLNAGLTDRAIEQFQRSIRIGGDDYIVEAHNNLGLAFIAKGRMDKAIAQFKAAIELGPDDPEGYNNLGGLYMGLGRIGDGSGQFEKAARLDPDSPDIQFNLGRAYLSLGSYQSAIEHLERARELDTGDHEIIEYLGLAFVAIGSLDKAAEQFQAAIRLKPDDEQLHYLLGTVYAKLERLQDAEREFAIVLDINPNNRGAREFLLRIAGQKNVLQ
jgi:tetratricopeptide (TPR) repeat protein